MFFVVLVDLIPPIFLGQVLIFVGEANNLNEFSKVIYLLIFFLGALLLAIVINFIQSLMLQKISQNIILEMRTETFAHI